MLIYFNTGIRISNSKPVKTRNLFIDNTLRSLPAVSHDAAPLFFSNFTAMARMISLVFFLQLADMVDMVHVAAISLGSNVSPRRETLSRALELLAEHRAITVTAVSGFLETEPVLSGTGDDAVGPEDQPNYYNGAALLQTSLSPQELLAAMHTIEGRLGRDRCNEVRFGPRTCDLDLLLFDELVLDTPVLTLPHPRITEREFVLRPLAQIAPEMTIPATDPISGQTVAQLLAAL